MRRRVDILVGFLVVAITSVWLWLHVREAPRIEATASIDSKDSGRFHGRRRADGRLNSSVATLRGTVRDPSGKAIAGATVCAVVGDNVLDVPVALRRESRCVLSNSNGTFVIGELYPSEYHVFASAPRHRPGIYLDVDAPPSERTKVYLQAGVVCSGIDIVLGHGGVLVRGVVMDLAGGPIAGAWVVGTANGSTDRGTAIALTNDNGEFELWCTPGDVNLRATADGYAESSKQGIAPGQTFELFLTPAAALVGTVVRADSGIAVVDALVRARRVDDVFKREAGQSRSDTDGRFRVDGLEPGTYKIEAMATDGYGLAREAVHVGLAETALPLIVPIHSTYSVVGRVVVGNHQGEPCSEGSVELLATNSGNSRSSNIIRGEVRLHAVFPGRYRVAVRCEAHVSETEPPVLEIEADDVVDQVWIVHPGFSIRGHVAHANGTYAAGVYIHASSKVLGADPRPLGTNADSLRTDDTGVFELTGLLPGVYRLSAWGSGLSRAMPETEVELIAGHDLDGVRIELTETGAIRGTVHDDHGEPQGRISVQIRPDMGDPISTMTTDDGHFEISYVTVGSARVSLREDGGLSVLQILSYRDGAGERLEVKSNMITQLDLVVPSRSGTIRGRVVDVDGDPVPDAFVHAEHDSASAFGRNARGLLSMATLFRYPALTDMEGRFTLTKLTDGTYTLRAFRQGGGEGVVESVSVSTNVTIALARPGVLGGTIHAPDGGVLPERFSIRAADKEQGLLLEDEFFRTNGAWRLTNVPPGKYEIRLESNEGTARIEVELKDDRDETSLVLVLERAVRVTGTIVDSVSGQPVQGMRILLADFAGKIKVSDEIPDMGEVSGADGRFVLERVAPGIRTLHLLPVVPGTIGYVGRDFLIEIPSGVSNYDLSPISLASPQSQGDPSQDAPN